MSIVDGNDRPESECSGGLKTELSLALPGGGGASKRGFAEAVDLNRANISEDESSIVIQSSPPEGRVVGWPPVRSNRKKMMKGSSKFVKVAVDGAPYLRKIDLEIYNSYQELLAAFEDMFACLTTCEVGNERKMMDSANGTKYVPTYEDKDGDWMLVGDVPWRMFVESCKRLRLMKSSEAIQLGLEVSEPKLMAGVEVKNLDPVSESLSNGGETHRNGNVRSFKIFIGYDPREDIAYEVCRYSLLKRASIPIEVYPVKQSELREMGVYWRERGKLESTEFSFSRFLTPYLANYEGWAMFVDCDFLYLDDIKKLVDLIDDKYAIMCVQHDYTPKETTKMDGAVQTAYPRKNWSSMVLYNCGNPKNKSLTPEVVNKETGAFLHRFQWLNDDEIGEIPFVWNFLVGHNEVVEGDETTFPKAIHYTLGGPWFEEWKDCEFGDVWVAELEEYQKAQ